MGCVYVATCRVNGKQYAGKSIHPMGERRLQHEMTRNRTDTVFARALRKYGIDAFDWEEWFERDKASNEVLCNIEIATIEELGTRLPNGYNMTIGGDGVLVGPLSEEHKRKISEANKGIPKSLAHRAALSLARKGKPLSTEHVQKLKDAKRPSPSPESNKRRGETQKDRSKVCGHCGEPGHNRCTCPESTPEERAAVRTRRRPGSSLKGKTYEEIHGDLADEMRKSRGQYYKVRT